MITDEFSQPIFISEEANECCACSTNMSTSGERKFKTFKEWLQSDETLIMAEGYLMEFERRGYLKGGHFVPEVVLEHTHLVRQQHEEFLHAGSDAVLAFTYNAHRKRLSVVGQGDAVEKLNRTALATAKEVAVKHGVICASCVGHAMQWTLDEEGEKNIRDLFEEQFRWAKEAGMDYLLAETLGSFLEAKVAIDLAKELDLPIVVAFNLYRPSCKTHEGWDVVDACQKAEEYGADVVGVNCGRGPATIIPILKRLRQKCKGPLAALPCCYRTTEKEPSWFQLSHPETGQRVYPKDISLFQAAPSDIEQFAKACKEIGIRYVGLCCGNTGCLTRTLAEAMGRNPPASRYTAQTDLQIRWLTE